MLLDCLLLLIAHVNISRTARLDSARSAQVFLCLERATLYKSSNYGGPVLHCSICSSSHLSLSLSSLIPLPVSLSLSPPPSRGTRGEIAGGPRLPRSLRFSCLPPPDVLPSAHSRFDFPVGRASTCILPVYQFRQKRSQTNACAHTHQRTRTHTHAETRSLCFFRVTHDIYRRH